MKIKRILAMLLTLSIVFAMCSFTASASSTILTQWDTASTLTNGVLTATTGSNLKTFGKNVTIVGEAGAEDSYFVLDGNSTNTYVSGDTPVISFKCVVQMPEGDYSEDRDFRLRFTKLMTSTSSTTYLYFYIKDDKISADQTYTTATYTSSYPYDKGEWVTIESRTVVDSSGILTTGVYANGTQVYYGIGNGDRKYTSILNLYTLHYYENTADDYNTRVKEMTLSVADECKSISY